MNRDRLLARDDAMFFGLSPEHPVLTVNRVIQLLDCSRPAAGKAVGVLEAAGHELGTIVRADMRARPPDRGRSGAPPSSTGRRFR